MKSDDSVIRPVQIMDTFCIKKAHSSSSAGHEISLAVGMCGSPR